MDGLDRVISAVENAAPEPVVFTQQLTSGRVVQIRIPLDVTVIDILELVARISGQLPFAIAQQKQQPRSRLVIPT